MKKSIRTFFKHPIKDKSNGRQITVIRTSTFLRPMQELYKHEKELNNIKKLLIMVMALWQLITIELENILKELEQAFHVF